MTGPPSAPIDVHIEKGPSGEITSARIRFGPHFIVEVQDDDGKVTFRLVVTHHGFEADASRVSGELESIIEEVRAAHPDAVID